MKVPNPIDCEIVEYLNYTVTTYRYATELLLDSEGEPRRKNFIHSAHFILNEVTNELERYSQQLRANAVACQAQKEFLDMLKREKDYQDDARYFERLKADKEL